MSHSGVFFLSLSAEEEEEEVVVEWRVERGGGGGQENSSPDRFRHTGFFFVPAASHGAPLRSPGAGSAGRRRDHRGGYSGLFCGVMAITEGEVMGGFITRNVSVPLQRGHYLSLIT